ncbi:MAG TPA: type II secretion system protein [Verrucomicrobiae bacterium]|nr:type II secretion system protein [Verrucomicrobiae bacterium]
MIRRSNSAAFTLIEVLVVTGIIGILAGLLLSALGRARARGDSARCTSNLRQWGLALEMYMDDYDEYIPRRGQGVQPLALINRPEDWFNCLPEYFGGQAYNNLVAAGKMPRAGDRSSAFIDPSAKNPGGTYFLPYCMNMYLSPWIRPSQHNLREIPNPGQLAFMADAPGQYASTVPSQLGYSVIARHLGWANVLFVDGRAQAFSGGYIGCGVGEPQRSDIRWQTLTDGINQAPVP